VVSPGDRNHVFIVEAGMAASYSRDGGQNWQAVQDERGVISALSLAVDPVDTQVIYLGTEGNGVYKSTDGGETWVAANRGMLDYAINVLAVDPVRPQTVYAGGDRGELFKTADGGGSWSDITGKLSLPEHSYVGKVGGIVIDPAAPDTVYLLADGVGLLASHDGGERWQVLGKPGELNNPWFTAMLIRSDPQLLLILGVEREGGWRFAADNPAPTSTPTVPPGGVTLPSLPAGSWQRIADLPRQINALVADPTHPQVLYAGTGSFDAGSGVYKSEDAGLTWRLMVNGLPQEMVNALAFSGDSPPILYAQVGHGEVYASVDGAQSWSQVGVDPHFSCSGCARRMVVSPGDRNQVFIVEAGMGASYSRDGGQNWQAVQDERGVISALSLAVDPVDTEVVYLGTEGNGVYKSTDGGETWVAANRGMLDYAINALVVDPARPQTVYAGGDRGELFKSSDGGGSWSDITGKLSLPEHSYVGKVGGIVIDPAAPDTVYLLADGIGLLASYDGGERWQVLGKPGELNNPWFTAMLIRFDPQLFLIVGVQREGGWRYASD
jgi:photosystem II stability/assembly factor-like uncharacterized protein